MKVKVFEIVKTGLAPLSQELEETIQTWLDSNENIEILTTSQLINKFCLVKEN